MIHIRIHYVVAGGHVHCGHFSGELRNLTHGKNGDLVFDTREWPEYRRLMESVGVEFVEEEPEAKESEDDGNE